MVSAWENKLYVQKYAVLLWACFIMCKQAYIMALKQCSSPSKHSLDDRLWEHGTPRIAGMVVPSGESWGQNKRMKGTPTEAA